MQLETQYFLTLLIAHLLADFPFQTTAMVKGKIEGKVGAYLRHLGVHAIISVIAVGLLIGWAAISLRLGIGLVALLIAHGLLDWAKSVLVARQPASDGGLLFVIDQLLHVMLIWGAVWLVIPDATANLPLLEVFTSNRQHLLIPAAILLITVFPAGYLIRYLLRPLSQQLVATLSVESAVESAAESAVDPAADSPPAGAATNGDTAGTDKRRDDLSTAGLYLGWLERGLMTIAIAADSMGAVGIILGAKSIARFPEFKSRSFAEYFLIGTLLSVLFAFGGGLLIKWLT